MFLHAVRAHLAEFGIAAGAGIAQVTRLVGELARGERTGLTEIARFTLEALARLAQDLQGRFSEIEKRLTSWRYQNDISNRLETISGVGVVTASALASKAFSSGRHFAAWLGLVPRQNSSGGKNRFGRISKRGDRYIRQLLILCATAALLRRRPPKVVAVALANKMARIAWMVMTRGGEYDEMPAVQAA